MNNSLNVSNAHLNVGDWTIVDLPKKNASAIAGHKLEQIQIGIGQRQENQSVAEQLAQNLKNGPDSVQIGEERTAAEKAKIGEEWTVIEKAEIGEEWTVVEKTRTGELKENQGSLEKFAQNYLQPQQRVPFAQLTKELGQYADICKKTMESEIQRQLGYEGAPIAFPGKTKIECELKGAFQRAQAQLQCILSNKAYTDQNGVQSKPTLDSIQQELSDSIKAAGERFVSQAKADQLIQKEYKDGAKRIAAYHVMAQTTESESPAQKLEHLKRTLKFALSELGTRQKVELAKASDYNKTDGDEVNDEFIYEADDKFAYDTDIHTRIRWLLDDNHRFNDPNMSDAERMDKRVAVLEKLLTAVLTENADGPDGVEDIASAQGYDREIRLKADVDRRLNSFSGQGILKLVRETQHFEIAKDPKFTTYVLQHAGNLPREVKNGEVVLKAGGWDEDKSYYDVLKAVVQRFEEGSEDLATKSLGVEGDVPAEFLNTKYSVDDFRGLFDTNEAGFTTPPERTSGTLSVNEDGVLQRGGNKASFEDLGMSAETSLILRMKLVDAFRAGGADEKFLKMAENQLGLHGEGNGKPAPCSVVKALIVRYDAHVAAGDFKSQVTPSVTDTKSPTVTPAPSKPVVKKRLTERKITYQGNTAILGMTPPSRPVAPTKPTKSARTTAQVTALATKLLDGQWTLTDNPGGGSCFFYAALQGKGFMPGETVKVDGYGTQDANQLRQQLIAYENEVLDKGVFNSCQGLKYSDGHVFCKTDDNFSTENGQPVTEALLQAQKKEFANYKSDADIAHGAFLASMLRRPVVIICDLAESKSEPNAMRFDYDVKTGQKLPDESPIVMYYSGSYTNGGHFQVLTPAPELPQA